MREVPFGRPLHVSSLVVAMGVSMLLAAHAFVPPGSREQVPKAAEIVLLGGALAWLSVVDARERRIPNASIVVALGVRFAYVAFAGGAPATMAALAAGLGIAVPALVLSHALDAALGKESLGGGDVKLLFVVGACVGWMRGLVVVGLASAAGAAYALAKRACGRSDGTFAFGPFLSAACFIMMTVGPS